MIEIATISKIFPCLRTFLKRSAIPTCKNTVEDLKSDLDMVESKSVLKYGIFFFKAA